MRDSTTSDVSRKWSASWSAGRPGSIKRAAVALLLVAGLVASCVGESHAFDRNPLPHTVVVDWIDVMLEAVELNPPAPTATTWRMWVVASSMYDAWSAYDPLALATTTGFQMKAPRSERTEANEEKAVSYAAHRSLSFVYPDQRSMFDDLLAQLGLEPSDSGDTSTPEGVGNVAAQEVIDERVDDGSNALGGFEQLRSEVYPTLYEPVNSGDPTADDGVFGSAFDPNRWAPLRVATGAHFDATGYPAVDDQTPSSYATQKFLTPHWGAVTPFAMTSGDQFRPPPPPQYGSLEPYEDALGMMTTNHEAWHEQVAEIAELNAALSDEQKILAEFWADGPRTWTPPGHWVQLGVGVSLRDDHDIDDDARLFMALTGAMLDAGISAWDAKRVYDYIRPISAIRHVYAGQPIIGWGGPGEDARLVDGATWQPYQSLTFVTPPFAEYTSGHSTFSRSGAEVLTAFTGSPTMYDGETTLGRDYDRDGTEDLFGQHVAAPGSMIFEEGPDETVTLRWDTFYEAADEAGISRRYGGIHFQDADLRGRAAGEQIGKQAFEWAELHWHPFAEVAETVEQMVLSRDVDRRVRNVALAQLHEIGLAFDSSTNSEGCDGLVSMESMLEDESGISEQAEQRLGRQLRFLGEALCSGDR